MCRAINPRARILVGETALDEEAQALQAGTKPVLFSCLQCGAALRIDGTTRAVTCEFCSASNYLPDGVWMLLHPVPKPRPFHMLASMTNWRTIRWLDENARCDAANPGLSPELCFRLARDPNPRIRERVAANPAAPADVLALLVRDSVGWVAKAAAPHPFLPPAAVAWLATSDDSDRREIAARHPNAPHETLRLLARDRDADVKSAARERIRALEAAGVIVGGRKSLLDRLLGR